MKHLGGAHGCSMMYNDVQWCTMMYSYGKHTEWILFSSFFIFFTVPSLSLAWDGSWPFNAPRTWSKLSGPQSICIVCRMTARSARQKVEKSSGRNPNHENLLLGWSASQEFSASSFAICFGSCHSNLSLGLLQIHLLYFLTVCLFSGVCSAHPQSVTSWEVGWISEALQPLSTLASSRHPAVCSAPA